MSTRDPRSLPPRPVREVTQSLEIDPPDADEPLHDADSLARGTHGDDDRGTKADSPAARSKPPTLRPLVAEAPEPRLGTTLGSYRVLEVLGKGGMGFVYRAEHVKLGREVALKLLRGDYARRRDAVARFIQEARTVNRIRHRNIVDVPDIVELDDGTTFIVMELLRGQSLGAWARTGIDLPRALAVLVQICDGLAAAHAVDVVHRDLKPDNVFVVPTSDGAELVKLLDFGVAKLLHRDDEEDEDAGFVTAAGSVIGTPAYMSPEQAGGMPIDGRSDIYSLGAIMYELVTGQPLFRGRAFGEYVRKHLTEAPIPPHQTKGGAGVDPRLEAIILRCLEKEPERRFATILQLREALLGLLGGMETLPPTPLAIALGTQPPPPPLVVATPAPATPPPIVPSPARTPLWVWLGGGLAAIAIGVGGALWLAGRDDTPPTPRARPSGTPAAAPGSIVQPIDERVQPVTIKLDSLPSASVFEDGHAAELCKTPCAIDVEPSAGTRVLVVRADGYQDGRIVVDLAQPRRAFRITLEPLRAGEPEIVSDPPAVRSPIAKRPIDRPHHPHPVPPPPVAVDKPAPVDKPVDKPEPVDKPAPAVPDTSETLDPFKHKRP